MKPIEISNATAQLLGQIDKWFIGESLPLRPLPACATLWWLERLVSAIKRLPGWAKAKTNAIGVAPSAPKELPQWLAAATLMDGWPHEFFAFLDDFQHVAKHRSTNRGLSRSFGLMLREAKYLEDLGYSLPADALREYLTDHYAAGHVTSKACLFSKPKHAKLLRSRRWVSFTQADDILRFRNGGSAELVERGILTGTVRSAESGRRTVGHVTRESVDEVSRELKTAFSVSEISELLGLGRSCVLKLIKADLLPRGIWTKGGWHVPRASVNRLLDSIDRCSKGREPSKHWLNIQRATRQFGPTGLNFTRLLRLIQTGQVRARRTDGCTNLRGLLVSASDLKDARSEIQRLRDADDGFPLCRLSKILFPNRPIKEVVLRKWIAMDLLRATRHGRAWCVSADELTRFREEYCLVEEASHILQVHRRTLVRWISEGELNPVYGPRSATGGFHLLLRSDVAQLRDFVARHHRKWRRHKFAA